MSQKNPNAKIKRWQAFINENSPKMVYKPGPTYVVADALSRQNLNQITEDDASVATQHSAQSSDNYQIEILDRPVNQFTQKIIINKLMELRHDIITPFRAKLGT